MALFVVGAKRYPMMALMAMMAKRLANLAWLLNYLYLIFILPSKYVDLVM